MKNCNSCFWCRYAWTVDHFYKCKMGEGYFENPRLKGYFCKWYDKNPDGKLIKRKEKIDR